MSDLSTGITSTAVTMTGAKDLTADPDITLPAADAAARSWGRAFDLVRRSEQASG